MYLKQLYLRGFKTFAEPTTLQFDSGITAIVGPNGVGKSNVVDALLWALGEQSPRTLRTSSLQEVIFAGTEERRPLGMADVTVTLDNSDGSLPTDYIEVAITRRLFRSGQSEYLLNRTPTRLRALRDLLLDTGLGPEAYSVIGQGQIDAILSLRPEDRRELLEEAAGVRKYRVRRDEAERRLENTRRELRRLRDIITELAGHLKPLEEAAVRARRYNELHERLRALELRLLASEYITRRRRRGRLENDRVVAQQELSESRERLRALEADLAQSRRDVETAQARAEELRDTALELSRQADDVRRRRDLAHHQRTSVAQQLEAYEQTRRDALARKEAIEQRTRALDGELAATADELEKARDELSVADASCADLEERTRLATAERQQRDRLISSLTARISRAEQEALGLQGLETELGERIARVEAQLDQMQHRHADLVGRREQLQGHLARARQARVEIEERVETCDRAHRLSRRWLEEHRGKLRLLRENLAAVDAVLHTLDQLARSHATLSEASAAVMQAAAVGQLPGVLGPVAALMEVPAGLEAAVATALGEKAQWIVVRNRQAALAAARLVSQRKLGRLGLLILDELQPADAPRLPDHGEAGRRATDLVRAPAAAESILTPAQLASLLRHLLGDVLIVADLQTALSLGSRWQGARAVTTEGEMVRGGEIVVGGPTEKQSPALAQARDRRRAVERRELIQQAEARLVTVETRLQDEAGAAAEALDRARAELGERDLELREAGSQLGTITSSIEAAEQAIADLSADLDLLRSRLGKAVEQRAVATETAEGLRAELERLRQEPAERTGDDLGLQVAQARERAVAAQIRVAQLGQRLQASRQEHERGAAELLAVEEQLAVAESRVSDLAVRLSQTDEALAALPEVEPLEQRLAVAQSAADRQREHLRQSAQGQQQIEQGLQRARDRIEGAAAKVHQAELALAREEMHLAALAERLHDQYSTTPDAAESLTDDDFKRTVAEREAEEIKEQMRALGPVNLGAPEELERLRSRHDYLQSQLEDVSRARDELLELIAELDEAAKEEFLRAFQEVGEAFAGTFTRLFGGGDTRLELTNPEDPLEGGVDIVVRPPGKRLQNMILLSGGEKALTALAFIFALLTVRPSPFCVLDEIDAALDAASTDRFIELLRDFAQRSQFVVVTHNPQTITAADRLYGVTMQTPGVSMVLQVDLEEAQELAQEGRGRPQLRVAPAS